MLEEERDTAYAVSRVGYGMSPTSIGKTKVSLTFPLYATCNGCGKDYYLMCPEEGDGSVHRASATGISAQRGTDRRGSDRKEKPLHVMPVLLKNIEWVDH
uniref:Uncharacterized protein n=1 Tax=Thermosporothrix sp. COM3 TaxID=2490863 RepID=A0A455SHM2_9CHLR|nr:hypothetical protein KTC_11800 [Thermosporothrix sp. COM3]